MRLLTFLWYVSDILLDWFRKKRVMPIIRPVESELLAEVIGGGFPAMFQALVRAGSRMMATPLMFNLSGLSY